MSGARSLAGGAVLKIGKPMEISGMALASIIGIVLHAALPGKEAAGDTGANGFRVAIPLATLVAVFGANRLGPPSSMHRHG